MISALSRHKHEVGTRDQKLLFVATLINIDSDTKGGFADVIEISVNYVVGFQVQFVEKIEILGRGGHQCSGRVVNVQPAGMMIAYK